MPTLHTATVDYVLPYLNAFLIAFIPVFATVLANRLLTALAARKMDTRWFEAISRAGGEAYTAFLLTGKPVTDAAALRTAAQAGAAYLASRVPEIVLARKFDPADLAQIAGAELGKLLSADPTVSVATAVTPRPVTPPG